MSRQNLLATIIVLGLGMILSSCTALEEGATSGPPPLPDPNAVGLIFAVNAGSGTILPHPNRQTNLFLLTLEDVSKTTNYFSDTPRRMAGTLATADFMRLFPNVPGGLPHIALELADKTDPSQDVAIFEVSNPKYSEFANVLSFDVMFLKSKDVRGLTYWGGRADMSFPKNFEGASLFVDGVPCPLVLGATNCPH